MSLTRAARYGLSALVALAVVTLLAAPASAQAKLAVTGAVDVTNQYNFRGIRQNSDGIAIWPYIDFGVTGLGKATINIGTWNSFHSQINEADFGTDNKWYESDFYATVGAAFSKGSIGVTYTSYTSPADLFAHVKELSFKLGVDDSSMLGKGALKPYAIIAFELTDEGQADAGDAKGTYVELGVSPGYSGSKASFALPIKVGLSGKDYYEFGTGADDKFGYVSVAGIVTVPFGKANVHGGVEVQSFGDNLKGYNGFGDDGDGPAVIGTIGIGFAF